MSARASPSHLGRDGYWDGYEPQEFYAGEPILPRPRRRGTMLPAAIMLTILCGGGYAAVQTRDVWQPWLPADLAELRALLTPATQAPADREAGSGASLPPPQPLAAREISEPPRVEGTPVPNNPPTTTTLNRTAMDETASNEPASDKAASDETPEPLPPPVADESDPYQKRALAVGLHPGLSRVLLTRMSDVDYRNAAFAIKTALAKTRDGEVFTWPKKTTPSEAVFEVKFVKSASPDCRRYVVTIAKDRWATTARPMEKCGLSAPGKRNS